MPILPPSTTFYVAVCRQYVDSMRHNINRLFGVKDADPIPLSFP